MKKADLISAILELEPTLEKRGLTRDVVPNLQTLFNLLSAR